MDSKDSDYWMQLRCNLIMDWIGMVFADPYDQKYCFLCLFPILQRKLDVLGSYDPVALPDIVTSCIRLVQILALHTIPSSSRPYY